MSFSSNFGSNPFQPGGFGRELDKIHDSFSDKGKTPGGVMGSQAAAVQENYDEIYRQLLRRLVAFEEQLPQQEETAMKLTSFGAAITLRVDDLSHHRPGLVVFYGQDDQGRKTELVQHATQLSFLLVGMPRANPQEPKQEKGFHRAARDLFDKLAQTDSSETSESSEKEKPNDDTSNA